MSVLKIFVNIDKQHIWLRSDKQIIFDCAVSTATNGPGEWAGSECTPRGQLKVRAKMGAHCSENMVFVGRRATQEIYSEKLRKKHPERDWILTRILWLSGLEVGKNRLGQVDTMRRYIYIHGCPDEDTMGVPGSHGCIKMRNRQVIKLFDAVPIGTLVEITEY